MGQVHSLDTTPDITTARRFSRAIKLACDELYEDPFSRRARAAVLKLIVDDSPEADAALVRALAEMTQQSEQPATP